MSGNLLQDFLADYFLPRRHFVWGHDDCTIGMVSEWVKLRVGHDAAASLRGRYKNSYEAQEIVKDGGGLVAICDRLLPEIGRTDDPLTGDIGVVRGQVENRNLQEVMALRIRNLWCVRTRLGHLAAPMEYVAAWRIP